MPARSERTQLTPLRRTRPLAIRVRVSGATSVPRELVLTDGELIVGAGGGSQIVVSDPEVSREHLRASLVPEGVEVVDLESRNGTFYLGQRIHRMVLSLGSSLQIGQATLHFEPAPNAFDEDPASKLSSYHQLIGTSPASARLFATLQRLEGSLVNTLIVGESGVGKELVARALYEGSALAKRPYVIVNCASLRGGTVRSELFGHRKGAFTDAAENRAGAFEAADGGTLFLDEIGELSEEVQPLLLRALETGEVQRIGESEHRKVKVRVIAATHRDLGALAKEGSFREDLFYRLAVVTLRVPPLRERPEDIPLLADHFARQAGLSELPEETRAALQQRSFQGNARELRNAVQAWIALGELSEVAEVEPQDGSLEQFFKGIVDLERPFQEQLRQVSETFARTYLRSLLQECDGNRSEAARRIKLDRSYFGKLLDKYNVDP